MFKHNNGGEVPNPMSGFFQTIRLIITLVAHNLLIY